MIEEQFLYRQRRVVAAKIDHHGNIRDLPGLYRLIDGCPFGPRIVRYLDADNDILVGIKVAHYTGPEWTPVDEAVKAGKIANIPVMVDFGGNNPPLSIKELFFDHL